MWVLGLDVDISGCIGKKGAVEIGPQKKKSARGGEEGEQIGDGRRVHMYMLPSI